MSRLDRYIVGIDLGTTNCAVAYVDTKGRERPTADIQTVRGPAARRGRARRPRGRCCRRSSTCPGRTNCPPGAARLPWREDADRIVGEFARIQGARVPAHLVTSAKIWLCHPGVDREADILPWGAPADARRVSPVEASAEYLRHIRDAWNAAFAQDDEDASARAAGGRPDRAGVVRRGRARADRRGGEEGGAREPDAAGGAAGGVLLLDRHAPGRLAEAGPRRRADPRLRHRRRHDRLQPDHRRRDADRARASAGWPWATT